MNSLTIEDFLIPSADLGKENPLPPLADLRRANAPLSVSEEIPEEDRKHFGYGTVRSILPYSLQDGYERKRKPRVFKAAILENETLRATFLPEAGGRLWSLYHKPKARELLYVNPVFQPANLAVRNAWFSGGVEWNMSFCGHHPFTCETLHTVRLEDKDGNAILRMYEWERLRGLLFQLDFSLPSGSPVLLVRVRLVNRNPHEIPTYWWSNIAVPEAPGQRVIAPAHWAMSFGYGGGLGKTIFPKNRDGIDYSYPGNIESSNDFFFRLPDGVHPWITSLDQAGSGLFQASTSRLRGRKLFVWGTSQGGRNWQDFLTEPGNPYVEIQAGLGRTQAECVPMPAMADWSWMEAYGLLEADAAKVHGAHWQEAIDHVESSINAVISQDQLEAMLAQSAELADTAPTEVLLQGSGWGALEELRREHQQEPPLASAGTPFPSTLLGPSQAPWVSLLETGTFPAPEAAAPQPGWMIEEEWKRLLDKAIANGSDHAESWLQLGILRYAAGQTDYARQAWELSIQHQPNPVALRNLAILEGRDGNGARRIELMEQAFALAPEEPALVNEFLQALLEGGHAAEVAERYATLPASLQCRGRVRLVLAQAWLELGELDQIDALFASDWVIDDLKEGDNAMSDLWFAKEKKRGTNRPLPAHYDYRMRVAPAN